MNTISAPPRRAKAQASPAPSAYAIARAFEALAEARARLIAIDPSIVDDGQLYLDCLEGEAEGDPLAIIERIIRAARDNADFAALAAGRMRSLAERKARFEARAAAMRKAAFDMMDRLEIPRLECEDFTASFRRTLGHVIITDPKLLPERFVRIRREPDKAAINEALRANETVPGAVMSNPERILAITER